MDIGKINQIDSPLMTQIKSWTSVVYDNKTSLSSLIAALHSRFSEPAYSFKVTSLLNRCACLTEHLKTTEPEGDELFCRINSVPLQLSILQTLSL